MIGIIGAMDIEVNGIIKLIENKTVHSAANLNFYLGEIGGKQTVVARCGEGKVNAAICAQIMIQTYRPGVIVNTGVAGGLAKDLGMEPMSVAVANKVCQHDVDFSPIGIQKYKIPSIGADKIDCDKVVVNALIKACGEYKPFVGTIATGDQFIGSEKKSRELVKELDAIACEMEGGAIGQTCLINNVPFGVLRVISDSADSAAERSFEAFAEEAANLTVPIIKKFIAEGSW